ncbi:MAG: CBS domain-containing protein [Planctomycetes bacterium]|nr:CBS domain-containing protein [Planctomycetota bacterium]
MLRARDVMTRTVLSVTPDTPLTDAMELIVENRISGLPVVDEQGHLAGIITEADRLKTYQSDRSLENARVADCMSRGVITVDTEATLGQIADLLLRTGIRRLPVTSGGNVVGIISRYDVVRVLHRAASAGTAMASA